MAAHEWLNKRLNSNKRRLLTDCLIQYKAIDNNLATPANLSPERSAPNNSSKKKVNRFEALVLTAPSRNVKDLQMHKSQSIRIPTTTAQSSTTVKRS